jgi:hypothetical protein
MPIPWAWVIGGIVAGWLISNWFGGGGQQQLPAIDMNFIFIMIMVMLFLVLLITVL